MIFLELLSKRNKMGRVQRAGEKALETTRCCRFCLLLNSTFEKGEPA